MRLSGFRASLALQRDAISVKKGAPLHVIVNDNHYFHVPIFARVMRILFIDDDNEDFEMFCEASHVINPEIKCIFMHNGAAGLRYLREATDLPDYIFLDINMPIMGGIECLKQIRQNPKWNSIRVIIFSTAINPKIDYKQLGADQVLVKPTRYEDLLALLKSVLT